MSDDSKPKGFSESVAMAMSKVREQRIQRLHQTFEGRLQDPIPTVDALMVELSEGNEHPELWQKLHAAAIQAGLEAPLADAYKKCAVGPRMKRMSVTAQMTFLVHAADYFQHAIRDEAGAESFLEKVLAISPSNVDAFTRLEKRYEAIRDTGRLLDLYATVAASPPKPINVLAQQALNIALLPAKAPFSDATCQRLLPLAKEHPRMVDALEQHCVATKRPRLACALIERALAEGLVPKEKILAIQERAMDLYMSDPETAPDAILHAEELLQANANNAKAFSACERLMSNPKVGTRAAAALRTARQTRGK